MAKAILVMDMPESCAKCEFCREIRENQHCCERVVNTVGVCKRIELDVEFYQYEKPNWCPLKEVPEKTVTMELSVAHSESVEMGYREGYNACIDEILGGNEDG